MPADFRFTLDDLKAGGDDVIIRELNRGRPVGAKPLKTTQSLSRDPGRLSVFNMSQILMGKPMYNSSEDVLNVQELALTHLAAGGIADIDGSGKAEDVDQPDFKYKLLIPPDILAEAEEIRKRYRKIKKGTAGGGGTAGEAFDGVPEDVANSAAYQNTASADPNAPHVKRWVNLMLGSAGDDYNNTGQEVRGITDNVDPTSFDCSGLLWWATNQCIPGTDFGTVSWTQWNYCVERGTVLDNVDMAKRTFGAIIWPSDHNVHVGVSLGDGTVIESTKGGAQTASGNGVWRRDWGYQSSYTWAKGALHPLLSYAKIKAPSGGGSGSGEGGTGGGTAGNPVEGDSTEAQIWNFLVGKGLSAMAAAAVMGTLKSESGLIPDRVEGGSGIGYGLAQWSFGRRTALENFAAERGLPVSHLWVQLDYLWYEFTTSYQTTLGILQDPNSTLEDMVRTMIYDFERPREDLRARRMVQDLAFANEFLAYYGGG